MAIPAIPAHGANWDAWAAAIDAFARGGGGGSNLAVAATVTASGALVISKHNPVDATSGAKTMTLPTGAASGTLLSVEKTDAGTNAVAVTGNVRGVGSTSISLVGQNESLLLAADPSGSWWPVAGHRTKASTRTLIGQDGADATSPLRLALAGALPVLDPVTGKVRADQLPGSTNIIVSDTRPSGQAVGDLWGQPVTYDPTPIGWDGMWWASRLLGTGVTLPTEGTLVGTWNDLAGGASHATQASSAAQPTLRRTAPEFNSRPAVQFDPARSTTMQTALWTAVSQPNTIVMVASLPADSQYMLDGITNFQRKFGRTTTRRWVMFGSATSNIQTPSGVADALPHLFILEFNTTTSSIEVDGVVQALSAGGTTGDAGAQQSRALTFGSTLTPGSFSAGALAFVGRTNRLLTAAEKTNLRQGFRTYYGLTSIPVGA